ncbi:hypothetical protein HYALB_00010679 [Hymenoscyphus albidus]|uniref:AB hydrolase-1 domain-containing protein n=1 Tax=Hymenoscyphus albidus TaxID=595503 RepID=A0A9N9Q184_9HELO|nr:hypothetical protein HYALB_00010679 [Hymenoscyphus albidus]
MRGDLLRLAPSPQTSLIVVSTVVTTVALLSLARKTLNPTPPKIIVGPRNSLLPDLSKEEQESLPYPPDIFPGARDVESPYGTIRVYEWGPESGRKVLLIHGISTPCVSLGSISRLLVEKKNCRVMLLDLWGRGYSDSPDLPYDSRLYTTEILLALTSSPLAWTPDGFSIIGYSLGGGIAADFAAYFPKLVKGIALLAPSGLLRPHHLGWSSKVMFSGLIPQRILESSIRKRLTSGPAGTNTVQKLRGEKPTETVAAGPEDAVVAEATTGASSPHSNSVPLNEDKPHLTVESAVKWQIQHNKGFIRSFASSIKYSSISGHAQTWERLRNFGSPVVILAGRTDPIIIPAELEEDAKAAIGEENVVWRVLEGGHEFPITQPERVVQEIWGVWEA